MEFTEFNQWMRCTDAAFAARLPGKPGEAVILKALLMTLAWRANQVTGEAFPSLQQMADDANCSRDTAKRYLKKLVDLGVVSIVGQHPTKNGPVSILKIETQKLTEFGRPTVG